MLDACISLFWLMTSRQSWELHKLESLSSAKMKTPIGLLCLKKKKTVEHNSVVIYCTMETQSPFLPLWTKEGAYSQAEQILHEGCWAGSPGHAQGSPKILAKLVVFMLVIKLYFDIETHRRQMQNGTQLWKSPWRKWHAWKLLSRSTTDILP